jgi:hypothetical protein
MFVNVPSVRLDDFSFNDNASVYPVSKVCPISSPYVVVMRKMSKYTSLCWLSIQIIDLIKI